MLLPDTIHTPGESTGPARTFHHVVLTRLALDVFLQEGRLRPEAEVEAWLRGRMPAFRRVCQPSIRAQSRRPGRWILAAAERHRPVVEELFAGPLSQARVRPAWQQETEQGPELTWRPFAREILASLPAECEYVVTTRLDSDDALHQHYLRWAERYAQAVLVAQPGIEDFWLSFPVGAQLAGKRFLQYHHTRGHFLTRVVRRELFEAEPKRHAMGIKHTAVFTQTSPVFTPVTKQPMWLENIHGGNLMNIAIEGLLELRPAPRVAEMFGLDPAPWVPAPPPPPPLWRRSVRSARRRLRGVVGRTRRR